MPSKPIPINLYRCADEACWLAGPSIETAIQRSDNRNALYLVILDPRIPYSRKKNLPVLTECPFGEKDKTKWARDFEKIAYSKAMVCWRTGMSSRSVGEKAPYLYEKGDTKFPGGVVCDGLIVAASGLDWQMDEACAHMFIAFFWAQVRMARDNAMNNKDLLFF